MKHFKDLAGEYMTSKERLNHATEELEKSIKLYAQEWGWKPMYKLYGYIIKDNTIQVSYIDMKGSYYNNLISLEDAVPEEE